MLELSFAEHELPESWRVVKVCACTAVQQVHFSFQTGVLIDTLEALSDSVVAKSLL